MRTSLRLSAATFIVFVASCVAAYAQKYNFDGTPMAEPTTMERYFSWLTGYDILAAVVVFMLPGVPKTVCVPFAFMAVVFGWQFAICLSFAYYLLQFLIGGPNAYD